MKTQTLFFQKFCSIVLLFLGAAALHAQTAEELENLLAAKEISWAEAAYFTLASQMETEALSPQAAFQSILEQNKLPKNAQADAKVNLGGVSLILMRSFNLPGGLMYRFFPNTRYAYRGIKALGLIHGRSYASEKVSGVEFLQMLGEALAYSGDTEALAAAAARGHLLDEVNESLKNNAAGQGLSSGSEDIQGYDSEFELE